MKIAKMFLACILALHLGLAHAAEQVTYYHNNLVGSPIAATDETGAVTWEQAYDPWGVPLLPVNDARGFTGAAVDSSTDLVDMQARWYGPELGRMLSLDPPGFREDDIYSFNLYAYGNNNPYRYVDPDGEVVFVAILVVGAALTAYDTYHAYQEGGAKAAAKSLAVGATVTVLTGGAGKLVATGAQRAWTAKKILQAERVGSALKEDAAHRAASFLSKEQLTAGKTFPLRGGDGVERTLLQTGGGLNGKNGIYEYILDPSGKVTHQRFIDGGIINGIPNQKVPTVP